MTMTWGELIQKTLRSVLRDPDNTSWTPSQVYDALGWALDTFASHTAPMKEVTYSDGDISLGEAIDFTTTTKIGLPGDIFDHLDVSGQVFYTKSDGTVVHLDPANRTEFLSINKLDPESYFIWPNEEMIIGCAPGAGSVLTVRYFSYYETPTEFNDDEPVSIPRWSHKAVTTLVGAYCLEGLAIESANIDRWKDDSDSGNPEHNALRAQQKHLLAQYEHLLSHYESQDRSNFFRSKEEDLSDVDRYQTWG